MHGELAQLVALVAHGAAYLRGPDDAEPPELFPASSVFRFTNALEFRRTSRRLGLLETESVVARACAPWYRDLRRRGVTALRLVRSASTPRNRDLAPHVEAGFSGGLDVGIVARPADGERELWTGRWTVSAREHPEQRIWSAILRGAPTSATVSEGPALDAAGQRLAAVLDEAVRFVAGRPHFEDWERTFRGARDRLAASMPEVPHHPDLLPAGARAEGPLRLLASSSAAWVFGGMGSWNDLSFDGEEERYRAVTAELLEAVLDAVLAATNAPARADGGTAG